VTAGCHSRTEHVATATGYGAHLMDDDRTQWTDYGGLRIAFDDRVLEPRQWTTAQAHWAADLMRSTDGPVLELCAGVGHIGLLAVVGSPRTLVLVDRDETACDYARRNAAEARPDGTWEIRCGRVDEVVAPHEQFAGVIADPPWVPSDATGRFPEDPLTAIDGGPDGLDVAWSCIEVAARHLGDQGWLLLQLGTTHQVDAVADRLSEAPELGLGVGELREYGDRGVLVELRRTGTRPAQD
jgi:methylase of polypeptide subunit release factors